MSEYLYRVNSAACESVGILYTEKFLVLSETKCGVWIDYYGRRKFVNLTARKQFACKTEEEARVSFIKRKEMQIRILTGQLETARISLELAKSGKVKESSFGLLDYIFNNGN